MTGQRRSTDQPAARRRRAATLAWGFIAAVGLAVIVAAILVAFRATTARVDDIERLSKQTAQLARQINEQRHDSLILSCRRDVAQNRAILSFLRDVGARPRTLARGRRLFPVARDCAAEARDRTTP